MILNNKNLKNIIFLYFICFVIGFFIFSVGVQAASLGEQVDFFVDSQYDITGRTQLTATLKIIGEYVYFYIDDEYWNNLNGLSKNSLRETLEELADEFDQVIYPKERAVFGSEWSPGIDNDIRITVLVSELVDSAGGYVNIYDEYPKAEISSSNEREMIYMNTLAIFSQENKSFLAHEFQHLISFYQKTVLYDIEEDIWLNEARSEYAPTVCGYNDVYRSSYLADKVDIFLDEPSDPLAEWKNKLSDYGAVTLFMEYLTNHYGDDIVTKMILNNKVGIESINDALSSLGYDKSFSDVFTDWAIANYLNDCSIGNNNEYCYLGDLTYQRLNVDYSASYSGFPNLIVSRSSSIKDWSPQWYRFRQGSVQETDKDTLKLEFIGSANNGDFQVPYIIEQGASKIVNFMSLDDYQQSTVYIPNFTSLNKSIVMIPINQYKKSGFTKDDASSFFSFNASSVSDVPIIEDDDNEEEDDKPIISYPEGSLLRAIGDYKVYIIKGKYKRWIQTAEIYNHYGHLTWDDIINVNPSVLAGYQEAWMIRADGDKKVYELNADGTKHWLNMTAEQFVLTGHKWEMVYIVNNWERDFYNIGSDVMYAG